MLQIGDKMPAFAAYDETRKEVTDKDMLKKDQVKQYSEAKFIQAKLYLC